MQHIVNIAFDFDDETVRKNIEKNVEEEIIKSIRRDIEVEVFQSNTYYGYNHLADYCKSTVDAIIRERQDEIVEKAIKLLAEKLSRKKFVKEKVGDLLEQIED